MFSRMFLVCLSLSLCGTAAPLSCRWMEHRFGQYSENCLGLLHRMASNSTNTTEDAAAGDIVAFPNNLYSQASNATAKDRLSFTVQILEGTSALFEEDHSSASWQENTVEDFVNIVTQQAEGLRSCIGTYNQKKNNKLRMYFKRLSSHILKKMGHSAEAWELIRKEVRTHLMRADQLVSSLFNTN